MYVLSSEMVPSGSDGLARGILEASLDCIILLSRSGTVTFINEAGARLLELPDRRGIVGLSWVDQWPREHRQDALRALIAAQEGMHGSFEGVAPTAKGRQLWWDVTVTPIQNLAGDVSQLVVIARDVTSAREAFLAMDHARQTLDAVLSSTTDGVVAVDCSWNVTYLNQRASAMVGRNGALSVGSNLWAVYPRAAQSEFYRNYCLALEQQRPVEFEGYLAELGIWLQVNACPTLEGLSIFFRDITAAKLDRDKIFYLAHHDELTGLPNRSMFVKRLDAATQAAIAAQSALAVVYLDLDDFKSVNDTLGHDAGDTLLAVTAQRLRDCVQDRGVAARIGGDEFAILLDQDVSMAQVEMQVRQLQERLAAPFQYGDVQLVCRASIGISLFPDSDARPSEVMKNADMALYKAKRSGGKQFAFFDPRVREAMQKRVSALSCARDALERGAVVPFYQPKVSFRTGKIVGFEALLRWKDPRNAVQSPSLIGAAFEDPVLSVELGQRMRQLVVRDMQIWRDAEVQFGSIAINVAAQEFVRTDFANLVLGQLCAAHLPTNTLEVEVTETVFLDDGSDRVEAALAALHKSGVSIALDDFGTGYASLTHLSKFPVSWLKIDRSFVRGLGVDPDASAIVKAVLGLSHNLGIGVVAEGIETLEQWQILNKRGCEVAQGFLVGKPMIAERVPHFVRTWPGLEYLAGASMPLAKRA